MDVEKAVKLRRSVRKYSGKEVEEEKLMKVMEAARLAPSASNRQEWRFIAVRSEETRAKLAEAAGGQNMVKEAPVLIVCCAETDSHIMSCGQKAYPIDVAIAIDHMTLQAVELGLGSCWVGAFNASEVRNIAGIPEEIEVVELLTLGYPTEELVIEEKDRYPMEKILFRESWSNR